MDHPLDQGLISDGDHVESAVARAPLAADNDGSVPQDCVAAVAETNLPRQASERARTRWVWAICGFLLLAVGLVFGQRVGHDFIEFDDSVFVYENPYITPGFTFPGLWWALTDGPYGEWGPLAALSHMLDCQLYGLNPAGHYLTNLLLHGAASVLLFLVLLRMSGDLWPSAWVAAVFAIHPLHVESVAWIAERRDVLSGLFFMLVLGTYTLYAECPSRWRYLAVIACFGLGLMAKPILVTVPFVLLLLDYWPLDRFRGARDTISSAASSSRLARLPVSLRLVMEKIPLLALAAVSCAITLSTHATMGGATFFEPLPLMTRMANALVSYAVYVRQSFYPIHLAPFYPHLGARLPIAWVIASLLLLVALTLVAAYSWRRRPYLIVGWLWFLGMLAPVIGLVGTFPYARADRYTYLSQIGLSIALAWGVWDVYQSRQSLRPVQWRRWLLAVASAATVIALAIVAWQQSSYWRDTETLWRIRSPAPSGIRWLTIILPTSTSGRERRRKRSSNSAKSWPPIQSTGN